MHKNISSSHAYSVAVSIHKIITGIAVPGFVLAMIIVATIAMAVSAIITYIIIFYNYDIVIHAIQWRKK